MLRTLIIGLGRAGFGLHWAVLDKLRAAGRHPGLFAEAPVLALDPMAVTPPSTADGLRLVNSLQEARALLDPDETVVHLCTPPVARLGLLRELADAGFHQVIVEKPLAAERATAHEIVDFAADRKLEVAVVAPWLASTLTTRLAQLVADGTLGEPRSIDIRQFKPRMRRTLADTGHPTAFDIEPPHSLGVCLRLAGDARVISAELADMHIGDTVIPEMGRAELVLRHSGVTSRIISDLTAPLRERRIAMEFSGGHLVGHYPNTADDHYAQLRISRPGAPEEWEVFQDDALSAQLVQIYRDYQDGVEQSAELHLAARVVDLLADAKRMSRATPTPAAPRPDDRPHSGRKVSHVA
ncbi:Gfo/Idh/MocA family oxidoreductase [Streptomyces sp. N2-109]|uniref:Gfo/Idh/MocA family oxidoreductase n=1 Tax=Streptomyces gossypii TaxID=2883101 RepID=A0ABT2JNW8_9ACTN|nr:Gfo/Idh/MocA family oxidoreductase [Streptomyces gossypii]MCT2589574.1 Gfo/Idh/MocA family oxidoreductase [Streptomyces gossypii]